MTQEKVDVQEQLALLDSLELPEFYLAPRVRMAPRSAPAAQKATVSNNTSLLVTSPELPSQWKNDADASCLLAQLNSDKLYSNKESQTKEWYENYKKRLASPGYWVTHGFAFETYQSHEATFSIDKVALEILENLLKDAPAAKDAISGAIAKLKKMGEEGDPAANVFGTGSKNSKGASCMIGYASPGQSGPRIKLGAFYFTAQENITNLWAFQIRSKDIDVWYSTAEMEQASDLYGDKMRESVLKKLGNHMDQSIKDIEI